MTPRIDLEKRRKEKITPAAGTPAGDRTLDGSRRPKI